MDLRKIILPLHKWWWLLVLSTVAATAASFMATRGEPIVFQARTTLMVGATINDPNPTGTDFVAGEQLASAYAEIANRELVRNSTMAKLGITNLPEYIARSLPKTQIFEIIVTDQDRERAQIVANELAAQLILLSPTNLDPEEQARLDFVNEQLDQIEIELDESQAEIDTLKASLGQLDSAQDIANAQQQLTALETKLNTLHNTYAGLLASTNQEAINTLTIIEPAALPSRPVGPSQITTILLAAAVGLTLAISAAYILEYLLDNSLKFPEDAERIFEAPILGHVFAIPFLKRRNTPKILTKDATHPNAEAFRTLKTNLLFTESDKPLRTILVAGPDKQKGKTIHTINLALSMAYGGKKVILVDADMRIPAIHEFFDLPNDKGLADVLSNQASLEQVIHFIPDHSISVITAGNTNQDPAELLEFANMDGLLNKLKEMADIVIIDAPPFIISDASIMASKVDGVLTYIRPTYTKKEAAEYMAEQISRIHAKVLGISLDGIPSWAATYFAKVPNYQYFAPAPKKPRTAKQPL
jgi:capsular exopolysaccharide synthesis family protein